MKRSKTIIRDWIELINEEDDEEEIEELQKYKITVDFVVSSESSEEAQRLVKELIKDGILYSEKEIDYEWDIVDAELAEL